MPGFEFPLTHPSHHGVSGIVNGETGAGGEQRAGEAGISGFVQLALLDLLEILGEIYVRLPDDRLPLPKLQRGETPGPALDACPEKHGDSLCHAMIALHMGAIA